MLSVSNLLCDHHAGNEALRYGHRRRDRQVAAHGNAKARAPRPVVVWALTKACNLKCVHCYASAQRDPAAGELTFEEGKALLDDLRAFEVPGVLFSGGEPLVRRDALVLLEYARQIGLRCTLSTNGTLIDDAMAGRLVDLGLQYVGISVDGVRTRHDKLRGVAGCYDQTIAAIRHCRRRGLKVGVRFTVHALNREDLDAIFDLCVEHDVNRLCIYHLAYAGRGGSMQRVDLTPTQTRKVVDQIFERTKQLHEAGCHLEVLTVGNHADAAYLVMQLEAIDPERARRVHDLLAGTGGNRSGCNIASIDPMGNVHYDQFSWHYTCGNVREKPFSEIWATASDQRLRVLRDRRSALPQRCQSCRFLDICNGNLRTRAESATGNWLGEDPSCYLNPAETMACAV